MGSRFDLSWDTIPCDGASVPFTVPTGIDPADYDDLFRAWCRERHESIETKLYLDEALRVLKRLLAAGEVSAESRKRARRLLTAIKEAASDRGEETV